MIPLTKWLPGCFATLRAATQYCTMYVMAIIERIKKTQEDEV